MTAKAQISVRLDRAHVKLLRDLEPLFGNSASEVARFLLVESLQEKHGLELLREKRAIR